MGSQNLSSPALHFVSLKRWRQGDSETTSGKRWKEEAECVYVLRRKGPTSMRIPGLSLLRLLVLVANMKLVIFPELGMSPKVSEP